MSSLGPVLILILALVFAIFFPEPARLLLQAFTIYPASIGFLIVLIYGFFQAVLANEFKMVQYCGHEAVTDQNICVNLPAANNIVTDFSVGVPEGRLLWYTTAFFNINTVEVMNLIHENENLKLNWTLKYWPTESTDELIKCFCQQSCELTLSHPSLAIIVHQISSEKTINVICVQAGVHHSNCYDQYLGQEELHDATIGKAKERRYGNAIIHKFLEFLPDQKVVVIPSCDGVFLCYELSDPDDHYEAGMVMMMKTVNEPKEVLLYDCNPLIKEWKALKVPTEFILQGLVHGGRTSKVELTPKFYGMPGWPVSIKTVLHIMI